MNLSKAHVSTARVHAQHQMEYTLKGYAFDYTHKLVCVQKRSILWDLVCSCALH